MKLRHFYPCLLLAGMAVTAASCSEEATLPSGQGRNVTLTVNISRVGDNTRAVLAENGGDLACTWETDDHILVVDADGNNLGVLTLSDGAEKSSATFTGDITTEVTGDATLGFLYLGKKSAADLKDLSAPVILNYSAQVGSLGWLSANDLFCGKADVNIANSYVNVTDVSLARPLAFGKFEMSLPDGVTYGGQPITVSGDGIYTQATVAADGTCSFSNAPDNDGVITVTPVANADGTYSTTFYLTLLPNGEEIITPTFSVKIGDVDYSCSLTAREWSASEFVRLKDTYAGVKLAMTDPKGGSGEEEDDPTELVGPTFEVNGQKFRFTRANLHYNVANDEWYLPEKQTQFAHQSGRRVLSGEGTDIREVVDMFRWGTTGLGNARPADFYKESKDDSSDTKISNKLPSSDSDLNAELYTYDDKSFNGTDYDWGKAYSNTGKYYTLTETELRSVIDNNCVVLAKVDGMNGALLTDSKNFEALKTKKNKSSLSKLSLSVSSNSNVKWDMVALSYDELEEFDAVFFPAVGYHTSNRTFDYSDLGWYWTSTLKTSPNAVAWNFNGVANAFNLEGKYKGLAMAVRLVRKVK